MGIRALGYVRVSTDQQVTSGLGLDAQRRALRAEARHRGWQLELVVEDGLSAKDLRRPSLTAALERLDRGDAELLVASKLDRLSRSVADFGGLLDRAKRRGWAVVLLDLGVDTTTPAGELTANVVASTAQYERRLIGQRTRDALAEARSRGVRLGRPQVLPEDVVARIVSEQRHGMSLLRIAFGLTSDEIATARGGSAWSASSVQAVLRSQAGQLAAAGLG